MDGTQLFNQIRRPVMTAANQTPQYTDVRQAGHDGGDFLFVRKNIASAPVVWGPPPHLR